MYLEYIIYSIWGISILLQAIVMLAALRKAVSRYTYKLRCRHDTVIKLSSIQKQKCADCNKMLDWPLKEGQQPLVSSSRDKRAK